MKVTPLTLSVGQRRVVREVRPLTANQLHQWLRAVLDIDTPRGALLGSSSAPFDYLAHTFFEGGECGGRGGGPGDAVVWAPRGGGKTFYAAVATLLDLLFKPGVEVKVIAGSVEQGQRMHEHLRRLLELPQMRDLTEVDVSVGGSGRARVTDRRIVLRNGSRCDVLAQSHTSVRGARPQKLRCDEAELFDPEVWEAAQLVTRSAWCGGAYVRGAVEALSTMHRAHGLMSGLVGDVHRTQFRWTLVDVLERCEPARACGSCTLAGECGGRAKSGAGHVAVEDAVTLKGRVDGATWDAEMLCLRPSRSDAVFPEFDVGAHVASFDPPADVSAWRWVAGMDFGFRAPTVILWGAVDVTGVLRIVDERCEAGVVTCAHARAIVSSGWPTPGWIGVDPAGAQRSEQTGESAIQVLRRAGLSVRWRRSGIEEGLRAVRARLRPASGPATLFIHPRCARLIESIEGYRYAGPHAATPMKDGRHDHAIDALRYLVINLDQGYRTTRGRYA